MRLSPSGTHTGGRWSQSLFTAGKLEISTSHQQLIEDMMTLQEYFKTEPLGARGEMADYLGISLTWLSLLIHERRTASAALAVKIEKATQGLVTRKDLRPDLFFV